MADAGIKKYTQSYKDLPPISSVNEGYSVRYRLISEDRNRVSHWSPVYLLVPQYTYLPGDKKFTSSNQIASITWDPVIILKSINTYTDVISGERTSSVVTITTSDAHYMNVGDWVTIPTGLFAGTFQISEVTLDTFKYYQSGSNLGLQTYSPPISRITNSYVDTATSYDIWLRWDRNDSGDWIYKERVSTTSVSYPHQNFYTINGVIQPQSPNRLSVDIFLPGSPIERVNFLRVYDLYNETI